MNVKQFPTSEIYEHGYRLACEFGYSEYVRVLLHCGFNPNHPSEPLTVALSYKNQDIMALLLQAGALIDLKHGSAESARSALDVASIHCDESYLRSLKEAQIQANKSPNFDSIKDPMMPAMISCIMNDIESVKHFIKNESNIDKNYGSTWSLLILASFCCHEEIVKVLVDLGANILLPDSKNMTAMDYVKQGCKYNPKIGQSIIDLFTEIHDTNCEMLLLDDDKMCDIIVPENKITSKSIMDQTDKQSSLNSAPKKMIVQPSGDMISPLDVRDSDGLTVLMIASKNGNFEIAKLCVDNACNIDVYPETGTALMYACHYGHIDIVKMLVNAGANVDLHDNYGNTALDFARRGGQSGKIFNAIRSQQ